MSTPAEILPAQQPQITDQVLGESESDLARNKRAPVVTVTREKIRKSIDKNSVTAASSKRSSIILPAPGQFVINSLLQVAGFIAAIAFGIYAVRSVHVRKEANSDSTTANQLAILSLCLSAPNYVG
jgi:hypothetical protein